jgi:hypothetical protein
MHASKAHHSFLKTGTPIGFFVISILGAIAAGAETIYQQDFDNDITRSRPVSSIKGWQAYGNQGESTPAIGTVRNVPGTTATPGHVYISIGPGQRRALTGSGLALSIPDGAEISWDAVANNKRLPLRILIQIDGEWYASKTIFQPSFGGPKSTIEIGDKHRAHLTFTPARAEWLRVRLVSGAPLEVTDAPPARDLVSGAVTGVGFHLQNSHAKSGAIVRLDTLRITTLSQ